MAGPNISVGVDEFTLVLQSTSINNMELNEWGEKVRDMLMDFLGKSRIEVLFGPLEQAIGKLQAGYTYGLTYADKPWHFMIAWHDTYVRMGVCVRFSAYAYASYKQAYKEKYQAELNIATFLRMVQSDKYTTRLSRIDLTADYFDYPDPVISGKYLAPDSIYNRLLDGIYKIKNHKEKSTIKTFSAIHKDGAYETFYAGTKKGKTDGFLRCYDKKEEQIQTHGFRFQEAEKYKSWVRFETVFQHNYAHQISDQLLKKSANGNYIIQTEADLQRAIAKHIVDKYCFYDMEKDEPETFSEDLAAIAAGAQVDALSRPNARDNSLQQSINYLRTNSGLFSTFYKVYVIWGVTGEKKLLEHLEEQYAKFRDKEAPEKPDIQNWLWKHYSSLYNTNLEDSF